MRKLVCGLLVSFLLSCGDSPGDDTTVIITDNNTTTNNSNNAPNNSTNNTPSNNTPSNNTPSNNTPSNNTPSNNTPNNDNNPAGPTVERIAFVEAGFEDPAVAFTPNGHAHYAYAVGIQPSQLIYGTCTGTNCGNPTGWQWVRLDENSRVNDVRMQSDSSGRLHMVYEVTTAQSATLTLYATCASGCSNGNNWSFVDLTPILGGSSSGWRSSPLAVSAAGAVYLITSGAGIVLTQCLSNCADGANWTAGQIRTSGARSTLAADGTTLHHVINNESGGLVYRRCTSNCTNAASWQESPQIFAQAVEGQVRVAAANGQVQLVYNQGDAADATVAAQNNRLLYWTCGANCLQASSWSGVILAEPRDGIQVDMTVVGQATVLSFVAEDLTHTLMACEENCLDDRSWFGFVVDSSAEMTLSSDPYSYFCDGRRPFFAGWYLEAPVVAISPVTGSALTGSGGSLLRQCSVTSQYVNLPGMGRLTYVE